uniref:Uncharacterized protein n=1 Tax=Parascaris univalens TaxID=6257 RepID=A0A915C659_PARUN
MASIGQVAVHMAKRLLVAIDVEPDCALQIVRVCADLMDSSTNMFCAGEPNESTATISSAISSGSLFREAEEANAKRREKKPSSAPFCREHCMGVLTRFNYLCCIFARIVSVNPLEVEDFSGQINLGEAPTKHCKVGDYCYLLVDTCVVPPRCIRLTVVPEYLKPIAEYQLQLARDSPGSDIGDDGLSDSNSNENDRSADERGEDRE